MKTFYQIIVLFLSLITCNISYSQVIINEYSCSNISTIADNHSNYEDWIELYNSSAINVNLAGYYLSDNPANPTRWQFPAGINIAANGHLIIYCSNLNEVVGTYIHTNFKLTQTKPEKIVFSSSAGILLENITLIPTQKNHSRGRTTDGASTWSLFTIPTPGTANANAQQNYASKPIFSQAAGFYGGSFALNITSPDPNVSIHFTIDGSEPTLTSTLYASPINIDTNKVVRARTFSSIANIPPSFIESNSYFINQNQTVATISVFGDQVGTLLGGSSIDADAGLQYFNRNHLLKAQATGTTNKHGNDSWAYDQRGFDFVAKDQYGSNYALLHKLFDMKDRTEFQRIIVKALANDNYPFENGSAHIRDPYVHTLALRGGLYLDVRTYEPCVVYVNGTYWGVYDLREKVDDADFTDYYFNSGEQDIQMLKTWGGTWSEYGGAQAQTDWDNLKSYILSNNMSVASNYNYVDSLYNTKSLVDYFVLNSYVVCSDWLNWNTEWWRGLNPNADKKKWRYCLWDEDATFGHYINYTGVPDQTPAADPCNPEQFSDPGGQGHTLILNALLNNAVFKQYYVARFADLSNTVFKCDNMQFLLDSLINQFAPEMVRQVARWGGSVTEWQNNVQTLKNFIDSRCAQISSGMIDCYGISGPYNVTFDVAPANSGTIKVNSVWAPSYPWPSIYYGNMLTLLKAKANSGYAFDFWEMGVDAITPSTIIDSGSTTLHANQTIIAHFKKLGDTIVVKDFVVPNVFSPNGDGINDNFEIANAENWTINLMVFNRWGKEIYKNSNYKNDWNGKGLASGVYFYVITANATNRETQKLNGSVQLLR